MSTTNTTKTGLLRIIKLLAEKPRSNTELLELMGQSDSVIRTALQALEAEGMVRRFQGPAAPSRKPRTMYALTLVVAAEPDEAPLRQIHRPAGKWECRIANLLPKASPFDGLMA